MALAYALPVLGRGLVWPVDRILGDAMIQIAFQLRTLQPRAETQVKLRETENAVLLTSADRCSENIVVETVIISESKLRDVQRHVFLADLVEGADKATLDDRPEALNRVRLNSTDNVFLSRVINGGVP